MGYFNVVFFVFSLFVSVLMLLARFMISFTSWIRQCLLKSIFLDSFSFTYQVFSSEKVVHIRVARLKKNVYLSMSRTATEKKIFSSICLLLKNNVCFYCVVYCLF